MGARSKHSRKPEHPKAEAAQMHLAGMGTRQIAKALGVSKDTVPTMIEDSAFLKEYRRRLRERVPRALGGLDHALSAKSRELAFRAATWTLENTQVGVKKIEEKLHHHDEFDGRTKEECEFFAVHGRWPDAGEETGGGKTTALVERSDLQSG